VCFHQFALFCFCFILLSGTPVILQSGIPLPDKRTLELILDKLQKYVFPFPFFSVRGICGGVCFWVLFLFSDFELLRGLDDCRKDTYGVFAEPVDPEEVCQIFFL